MNKISMFFPEKKVANLLKKEAVSVSDIVGMMLPEFTSRVAEAFRQFSEKNNLDTAIDQAGLVVWQETKPKKRGRK